LLSVPEDTFIELLPVMRRAVGAFDTMERRSLLEKVRSGIRDVDTATTAMKTMEMPPAFEKALPLLKTILGLEP
jgi:hypothetical protein